MLAEKVITAIQRASSNIQNQDRLLEELEQLRKSQ